MEGSSNLSKWESQEVYQPFLVEVNETVYDFYNARGINEYGVAAEESGIANLTLSLTLSLTLTLILSLTLIRNRQHIECFLPWYRIVI